MRATAIPGFVGGFAEDIARRVKDDADTAFNFEADGITLDVNDAGALALAVLNASERIVTIERALHELIHPDNGYCNQCGGHWLYHTDGSWNFAEGEHTPNCVVRRVLSVQRPSVEEQR